MSEIQRPAWVPDGCDCPLGWDGYWYLSVFCPVHGTLVDKSQITNLDIASPHA